MATKREMLESIQQMAAEILQYDDDTIERQIKNCGTTLSSIDADLDFLLEGCIES